MRPCHGTISDWGNYLCKFMTIIIENLGCQLPYWTNELEIFFEFLISAQCQQVGKTLSSKELCRRGSNVKQNQTEDPNEMFIYFLRITKHNKMVGSFSIYLKRKYAFVPNFSKFADACPELEAVMRF